MKILHHFMLVYIVLNVAPTDNEAAGMAAVILLWLFLLVRRERAEKG